MFDSPASVFIFRLTVLELSHAFSFYNTKSHGMFDSIFYSLISHFNCLSSIMKPTEIIDLLWIKGLELLGLLLATRMKSFARCLFAIKIIYCESSNGLQTLLVGVVFRLLADLNFDRLKHCSTLMRLAIIVTVRTHAHVVRVWIVSMLTVLCCFLLSLTA